MPFIFVSECDFTHQAINDGNIHLTTTRTMRSQTTKPLPKKGALNKTLKASTSSKPTKKKSVTPKKVKRLVNKSLIKSPKRNAAKEDITNNKTDGEPGSNDKNEPSPETSKVSPSKANPSRSESPTKKPQKGPKEKKDPIKSASDVNTKKNISKKSVKVGKKAKTTKANTKKDDQDADNVKYKINLDVTKKTPSKFSKAKTMNKKSNVTNQKKKSTVTKSDVKEKVCQEEPSKIDKDNDIKNEDDNKKPLDNKHDTQLDTKTKIENKIAVKSETNHDLSSNTNNIASSHVLVNNSPETPKVETERPPKFFTSSRTPRTVDIDVKCCKNSKGNLSVSERFLSMKFETKSDDNNKEKTVSNTLVSQGPEIDVYTFTEKVDSPKSILSDFRSPINKNVGRVRPIARVKGTIIDKKSESEKKKYSPHRPIEEVVKQLKASKRSEDLSLATAEVTLTNANAESTNSEEKETDDKPKPIISKSYKMVARKSSVTGKPFSPIKFLDQDLSPTKNEKSTSSTSPVSPVTIKKSPAKSKKKQKKASMSDEDIDTSKFSLNKNNFHYTSSEESLNDSNDDNDVKESSGSESSKSKKIKNKKYKRITDGAKKTTSSKELKELSKDSLIDLKDNSLLLGEKPSKRRLKLLSMWTGPKKHRMASLNAMAKVHCLYENESRTHMELGLMKTIDRQIIPSTSKIIPSKKNESKTKDTEKSSSTSESEYENKTDKKDESSESSDDNPPLRSLRGVPGIRSAGKYWDPKSSTSSSEDSELETKKKTVNTEKKKMNAKTSTTKSDTEKPPPKMKKTAGVPVKKKRNRNEVVMDLKDMVVQKRMASLNATAILAASYEKRSPKSNKDDTTSDSCSDESFSQKPKNGANSGVKSETKKEDTKNENDETALSDRKQKVEVIVNQDTDVTITGVYSTHHEGFCTAMQYRISSTSHTQTTATSNCEKEGCSREDGARYTPLSALSSMQPPAEHVHGHPHPVPELGGLARRAAGCSSAFSAPSPAAHHEPGYYQPAGPLIKETGADAERALARYHPQPHYHAPHPSVLQQYGAPYYPPDLCYGRYYRPSGAYHMPPPQPDAPMVGVGSEPYPPPQYYGTPPCYQHSPQRIPYVEYRCPCPLNACPKNVLIGPATGKTPTGGGPADVPSALAPPGGAFRAKVRACALDAVADTHGSGKDPPLESEPPAASDAPHPCPLPAIGGASPKRELYDVRENLRLSGDIPGPAEAIGPPSPARGSAGACAPQPPPAAPRRARLGKAMVRRSLAGDDTGLLLTVPQPTLTQHNDADDDVLAISPPVCAPIDLSSSDERSTPLVDVKKENEGPTNALSRKTDAQALREHNCTTVSEQTDVIDTTKAVKRRYSKPKLEIDMKDTQLEDSCKTNGIGEHVKLQKRRKVSGDQTDVRLETVTKEPKKRASPAKRTPKSNSIEKKTAKRKLESNSSGPKAKKPLVETIATEDPRLKNVAAVSEESLTTKPKTKSALLLDNLIRKNSIDRVDSKGYATDTKLNPAELFLSPDENVSQSCSKKTLNINNNVVDNGSAPTPHNGVQPNTIAAVSQLIGKKLASKNACKVEKVDSKITHNIKSVLKSTTPKLEEDHKSSESETKIEKAGVTSVAKIETNTVNEIKEPIKNKCENIVEKEKPKAQPRPLPENKTEVTESQKVENKEVESKPSDTKAKRSKLVNGDMKGKSVEKVVKLLVSKRPAIKADEATTVVEEACAGVGSGGARRTRRRRSGGHLRRHRRPPAPLAPPDHEPRAPPRWSNGWNFDGEHYLSKVYLSVSNHSIFYIISYLPKYNHPTYFLK
ncbi:unnamed protein product [Diatraea saccharalis]|uniref:Uncharacterized protein n=1 Tax=Diatraea saccharalis TaxID=40085 RepID=A0A9N9WD82_9NEOP|nr:unnamed protein product [Diatraea saccharalis]